MFLYLAEMCMCERETDAKIVCELSFCDEISLVEEERCMCVCL